MKTKWQIRLIWHCIWGEWGMKTGPLIHMVTFMLLGKCCGVANLGYPPNQQLLVLFSYWSHLVSGTCPWSGSLHTCWLLCPDPRPCRFTTLSVSLGSSTGAHRTPELPMLYTGLGNQKHFRDFLDTSSVCAIQCSHIMMDVTVLSYT